MKTLRYLSLLLLLLVSMGTWGQYNPVNPPEPGGYVLTLKATPSSAGYFNLDASTTQLPGASVYLHAYAYSNYQFQQWEDASGNVVATSSSLTYTMPSANTTLVARYAYNPSSPGDPSSVTATHRLTLKSNPASAGWFNISSGNTYAEGATVGVHAYANSSYAFLNWTLDGDTLSTSPGLDYVIPDRSVTLTANYEYSPTSPGEPSQTTEEQIHLYGMRESATAGERVLYPVYLENTSKVTGFSVDVTFPEDFAVSESDAQLTTRANGQALEVTSLGNNSFRFAVSGAEAISGVNGKILEIPVSIPDTATVGNVFSVGLANASILKADGTQATIGARSGSLQIQAAPEVLPDSPDFTVSNIVTTTTAAAPGETIHLTWTVNNVGTLAATGGWSERVSLVDENGRKVTLSTLHYDTDQLAVGGTVNRQADLTLGRLPGIEGKVKVSITLTPTAAAGERSALQANNTTETADYVLTIGKRLFLTLPETAVAEDGGAAVRCQLARSGNWTDSETYALSLTRGDSRLTIPATVTIGAGQSAAYFYASVANNDLLDEDSIFVITASGNGYEAVAATLIVEDDELPTLTLSSSADEVTEGDTFTLTVTLPRPAATAVTIDITSEQPKRFSHAASMTVPAGETTASMTITVVDNDDVELLEVVAFKATATRYNKGEKLITLNDNDLPAIELTLSPATVSEAAGLTAIVGKVKRTTNIDKKVTILLTDDSDNELYYSASRIELAKGVEEAQFSLGVIDNAYVDGDRTVNVTAAVYVSSCNCSASGSSAGSVTRQIEITDDDGPSLALTASSSTLLEGNKDGMTLTVSRNTDTTNALTVVLSSDADDRLTYDHTVTIPAGQKSVSVKVTADANDTASDGQTVVFTAQSDGFSKSTCWVMLTDQTLPDATISSLQLSATEAEVGGAVTATVTIRNIGAASFPEATKVCFYLDNDLIATAHTPSALAAGDELTLTKAITLTGSIGSHTVKAVVNDGQAVKELIYLNNTSEAVSVAITSPFATTVTTDKATYQQGDAVTITGSVTGSAAANAAVEVYVINDGYRQVLEATTDANGDFTVSYQPYETQMGHFIVGACYPGDATKTEQAAFDIYGLKRTSNSAITCEPLLGEPYNGSVYLSNPGTLDLTGMKAAVLSKPDNVDIVLDCPTTIAGQSGADLSFTLTGTALSTDNEWQEISLQVTSAEGATLTTTIYYYVQNPQGQLQASIDQIKTTMIKGASRDYPFTISNTGKGATGKITLALPSWMEAATPTTMASLAKGESTTVVLRFTPTDDMQLNVPVTGTLGINCENGTGLSLAYSIQPVSETTGTLTVDVCDEYTYNTAEAPHVAGAKVLVTHPTTGATLAEGTTGADGTFSVTLPEGYYGLLVTESNHSSYKNNVLVDPSGETRLTVNLSYNAISVDWSVTETEVEDEYEITTTVKYETNVPMPVVELVIPKSIDALALSEGESLLFNATLTNHGLIRADDVELLLPTGLKTLTFEPLAYADGAFSLAPQQSVTIPVKVTKVSRAQMAKATPRRVPSNDNDPCASEVGTLYFWDCGLDRKFHRYKAAMKLGACGNESIDLDLSDDRGSGNSVSLGTITVKPHTGPSSSSSSNYGSSTNNGNITTGNNDCEPCQNSFIWKMAKCAGKRIPIIKEVLTIVDWIQDPMKELEDKWNDKKEEKLKGIAEAIQPGLKPVFALVEKIVGYKNIYDECLKPLIEPCDPGNFGAKSNQFPARKAARSGSAYPSYVEDYQTKLTQVMALIDGQNEEITALYGSEKWMETDAEELSAFWSALIAWLDTDLSSTDALLAAKPSSMSNEEFNAFVTRWRNTINDVDTEEKIDMDAYDANLTATSEVYTALRAESEDFAAYYEEAEKTVQEKLDEASGSVCASVTLQLSQTMTMTRQAFRGTLTVYNGNTSTAMTDVKLNLTVTDEDGNVATSHEFQINAEKLDGFDGALSLTDGWTLNADQTGTATILFVPTKYAAEKTERKYSFGGTLTYVDPFTGLQVTRNLYPATLTVKPSPNLDLDYFMQRDIYGDDPLTTDVVEPMKPAEFALIINNKGYGDATNVRMTTAQPEITENEKGLLVNFELVSSQVNGAEKTLSFGTTIANDFGTIAAHSTAYAQWWLQSTLLGHFTDYQVEANHVTSYGNEDLSLLDNVAIHELVHGFTSNGQANPVTRAFLVNDITDAEDLPDMVYFSDGAAEQSVAQAQSFTISKTGEQTYAVIIVPSASGWNYGSVADPTGGKQTITSITRLSDGAEMPLDNFWQTDRTLRDGAEPVYENRIHAIVTTDGTETYTLTFSPKPDVELEVTRFDGIPEEAVVAEPVTKITVVFNKAIDETSFTPDALTLNCQGKAVDLSEVVIAKVSDTEYSIDLGTATSEDGFYVLTVQTASITDAEGFTGSTGKQTTWTQSANITDITDITADGQLVLKPLPMRDMLYVYGPADTIDRLSLIDTAGYAWLSLADQHSGIGIDVSALPAGVYVIKVIAGDKTFVRKVIKK